MTKTPPPPDDGITGSQPDFLSFCRGFVIPSGPGSQRITESQAPPERSRDPERSRAVGDHKNAAFPVPSALWSRDPARDAASISRGREAYWAFPGDGLWDGPPV